jgi:sec-independent protein translocase protein TatA
MDIFAPSHLLILLAIVLIIFGPSKLGDVGGAMGRAIRDFKRAMNEPEDQKAVTMAKTAEPAPAEVKIEKPVEKSA